MISEYLSFRSFLPVLLAHIHISTTVSSNFVLKIGDKIKGDRTVFVVFLLVNAMGKLQPAIVYGLLGNKKKNQRAMYIHLV